MQNCICAVARIIPSTCGIVVCEQVQFYSNVYNIIGRKSASVLGIPTAHPLTSSTSVAWRRASSINFHELSATAHDTMPNAAYVFNTSCSARCDGQMARVNRNHKLSNACLCLGHFFPSDLCRLEGKTKKKCSCLWAQPGHAFNIKCCTSHYRTRRVALKRVPKLWHRFANTFNARSTRKKSNKNIRWQKCVPSFVIANYSRLVSRCVRTACDHLSQAAHPNRVSRLSKCACFDHHPFISLSIINMRFIKSICELRTRRSLALLTLWRFMRMEWYAVNHDAAWNDCLFGAHVKRFPLLFIAFVFSLVVLFTTGWSGS